MCATPRPGRSRRERRASLIGTVAATVALAVTVAACGPPERSGSSFCRQLGEELPGIGQPMATTRDVEVMLGRWERLLERAPLAIEDDMAVFADLLRKAASVDPTDATEVQDLADTSYESNQAAVAVRDWVLDTCAVDIATGLTVAPPRTAPPTTVPDTTVPVTTQAPTTLAPATTSPAATSAPTETTTPTSAP